MTPGDAKPSIQSRAAASPGNGSNSNTPSASAQKQAAPTSGTRRALVRRGELGATAATVGDESQDALAALLVDRDPTVPVGAFVPDVARPEHADRSPDLFVRRLDEEEALKSAVRVDRQDERRVSQRPGHSAAPRSGEGGGLGRTQLGAGAAGEQGREQHDGASRWAQR